ncbi:MAG: hypothetical protein MJ109_06730, partial [Kiritimatiellae bacterium]|nr:hypothetical protein [Kiritimatiellia bacterium]
SIEERSQARPKAKRHLAEYDQGAMRGEFGGRKSNGTKRKRGRDVETQAEVNLKITERLKDQSIEPFSLASTIAPKFADTLTRQDKPAGKLVDAG